ncbi:MAG TPA: HAMP domain-containing sensor histidine kinase [Candidatus Limnocylindrales bacterium]|nr:HAMP domain-containing sensor histidine kinase [Candidatus Limnocylindrales bacterium]
MTPLEAALLDVLEAEGAAVLVRAPDGAVTYANQSARALNWDAEPASATQAQTMALADGGTLILSLLRVAPDDLAAGREEMHHIIAHDLLTPIGVIDGFAELVEMTGAEVDEERLYIGKIRTGSARLALLARQIGRYAWLKAGLPVTQTRVDMGALLDELMQALAERAGEKAITLELRAEDDLPEVLADAPLLRTALEQIVWYGVLASARGQTVTIRALRRGAQVVVESEDRGSGIPAEDLVFLFEPNFSGGSVPSGHGLALAQAAVEAMGGQISAVSGTGEGTTLTVIFDAVT